MIEAKMAKATNPQLYPSKLIKDTDFCLHRIGVLRNEVPIFGLRHLHDSNHHPTHPASLAENVLKFLRTPGAKL